ncbi:MAG: substrate-binding domain-containing protein [Baekduia sp.]
MRRIAFAIPFLTLGLPAAACAQKAQDTFFNSTIPSRVDALIGFTPTTFGIHPRGKPVKPISVRQSGRTYRFIFGNAATATGPDITIYLRNMTRYRQYPTPVGSFVDRELTAKEKKVLQTRADIGRDADVLAVSRDHPACAAGVSRADAKRIAAGTVTSWEAVGVSGGGAMSLRRSSGSSSTFVEPRFGASRDGKKPSRAKLSPDGGLGEAAAGDVSIAAVTSYSRARRYAASICIVPVGGSAPDDVSVRTLSHPDAYPIRYVTPRWTRPKANVSAIISAFVKFIGGPDARGQFEARGMLPTTGPWPGYSGS